MTYVLRAASDNDLAAIYEMAKSTGGGFTNLPPDQDKLRDKLGIAHAAFSRDAETIEDDKFMFVLEDTATGKTHGTCQIFSAIGSKSPFYSYRIDSFSQYSKELDRTIEAELMTLCTDHTGCSEVGGLFLQAGERSAGIGALLARSRYLFIRMHRQRFAKRMIAELRGMVDEGGESPFWDNIGGRFFGMTFREADEFNAVYGNQFIADLMPKAPIFKAMLADSALHVLGLPHLSGRPAMRMLEKEGFTYDRYVDIFDGGPTMACETDTIASIRNAQESAIAEIGKPEADGVQCIVAAGRLAGFRSCFANLSDRDGGVSIDPCTAALLGVQVGDRITYVPR